MSERKAKWQNDYIARTYDRVNLTLPKGQKEVVQAHAAAQGESVNGFIGRAILEAMERDSDGTAPEIAGKNPESTPSAREVSLPSEAVRTAQKGAETGKRPAPVDKAKAWENISEIFRDMGAVDLERARDERLGIVCLPPDTLEAAQQAADAAGEAVADFMRRAVEAQAQRDQTSRKLGINPATGGKLEKEA